MKIRFRLKHPGLRGLLCVVLAALALPVFGDVVHMKNGDRLTGTLGTISGERLVLETEFAGRLSVDQSLVLTVETEKSFDLTLRDGSRASGRLIVADHRQAVLGADEETLPVGLDQLLSAGQNRLAIVDPGRDWSSRADLSAAVSTGNSDTRAYNALIETTLTRGRSEHFLSLLLSQEDADGQSTKDQFDLDYGYKRFFSDRWFGSGNFEYFEDGLKNVDYRVTAGAGAGYQFWGNSFGALSAELGANLVVEELGARREENPAMRWALKYNRFLWSERVEVFHNHSVLVIPDRGEVIESSTGIRMAVNHRIDTHLRVDLDHETDPADDNDKTDMTYSLGIGFKF
ncbi:MAG: DUF481 domain-containing protein [Pseudomonadales bacterium]